MQQYYNPETQQVVQTQELKRILHASIPANTDEVDGWHRIYTGTSPATQYGQSIVPDEIIFDGGRYVQTYRVVGDPTPEPASLEQRMGDIEDALIELAGIIGGE